MVDRDGDLPLHRRREQRGRAGPRRVLLQHARPLVRKVPRHRRAGPGYDVRRNLQSVPSARRLGLGRLRFGIYSPFRPVAQPFLLKSLLPKQILADSGTANMKVNQIKVRELMENTLYAHLMITWSTTSSNLVSFSGGSESMTMGRSVAERRPLCFCHGSSSRSLLPVSEFLRLNASSTTSITLGIVDRDRPG